MQSLKRFAGIGLLVIVLTGTFIWYQTHHISSLGKAAAQTSAIYAIDDNSLAQHLNAIIAAQPDLELSISLVDLQTGKKYHYGEATRFEIASIGKLISASALLHQAERGTLDLDAQLDGTGTSARDLLTSMVVDSDNDAWAAINQAVTPSGLAAYAAQIGLTSYDATDNIMNSDDAALLLSKLSNQTLLDSSNTSLLLSLMKTAGMRTFMVPAVPSGVTIYHKVGYLDDRLHEAAILQKGSRSYALVIFSKQADGAAYDYTAGAQLFQSITTETLSVFFGQS